MKKAIFILLLALFASFSLKALAETAPITISLSGIEQESVATASESQTPEITAEDLDVKAPLVPPGHWAFGLKRAWRRARLAFVFNPIKRAKIQTRYTNRDLIGIKKMLPKIKDEKKKERILKFYQKEQDNLTKIANKIKEKVGDSPETDKLIEWITQNRLKHVLVLDHLSETLPPQAEEKGKKIRDREIEKISARIEKLEESGKMPEFLDKMEELRGAKPPLRKALLRSKRFKIIRQKIEEKKQEFKALSPEERQELMERALSAEKGQNASSSLPVKRIRPLLRKRNFQKMQQQKSQRTLQRRFIKRLEEHEQENYEQEGQEERIPPSSMPQNRRRLPRRLHRP